MAYLYRHIRLDKQQPFYIGIGSDELFTRAHSTHNRNRYWHNIVAKTDYEVEIILSDITWEEACVKEKEFIALYGRELLCNLTDGGEGVLGIKFSPETLKKLSEQRKGRKQSPESIIKRAAKLSGPGNPWFGKKLSEEHRRKMSEAKLGKKQTVDVIENRRLKISKKVIYKPGNIIFNSINEAALFADVPSCTMSRWIKSNKRDYIRYENI